MATIKQQETSAGRVLNSSLKEDPDAPFRKKFGAKWNEYRRNWAAASRMEYRPDFPLFVRFETKFRCNLHCKMCVHGHPDLEKGYSYAGEMDFKTYCRLIDECAEHDCPSIGMNHANEPLLDKDLIERVNYATKCGIMDIHMNTNAMLLTEEMSKKLLDTGLTRLCFSVDALTPETFKKIRVDANYNKVMAYIDTFLNLKIKRNVELPATRVSLVLQEDNKHEVEAFCEYWVKKVDYVAIQRYVPISPFDQEENDSRAHATSFSPKEGKQKCSYTWESLFIHGDGLALPCAAHRARKIAVGNIHKNSLYEIWNSPAMEELRKKHKEGNLEGLRLCPTCIQ
jgi:radical SAM protein with 4Fe4S-binding SPASM domain